MSRSPTKHSTQYFYTGRHEVLCNLLPDGAGGGHGGHSQREAQDLSYRHCGQPRKFGKTRDKLEILSLGETSIMILVE